MVQSHKQHRWSMKRWQVALAVLLLVLVLAGVYVFMVLTKTPSAMLRDSVFAAVGAAPVSGTAEASSAVVGTITQADKSRVTLAGNQAQFASRITTTLSPDITLSYDADVTALQDRSLLAKTTNITNSEHVAAKDLRRNEGKWVKQANARTIGRFIGAGMYGCVVDLRATVLHMKDGLAQFKRSYQQQPFLQVDEAHGEHDGWWRVTFDKQAFNRLTTSLGITSQQLPSCQQLNLAKPQIDVQFAQPTGYAHKLRVRSGSTTISTELSFGSGSITVPQTDT